MAWLKGIMEEKFVKNSNIRLFDNF